MFTYHRFILVSYIFQWFFFSNTACISIFICISIFLGLHEFLNIYLLKYFTWVTWQTFVNLRFLWLLLIFHILPLDLWIPTLFFLLSLCKLCVIVLTIYYFICACLFLIHKLLSIAFICLKSTVALFILYNNTLVLFVWL